MCVFNIAVHGTDHSRLDLIVPGEQHFYIKASNPQERQEWLVALGSTKASMGKTIEESGSVYMGTVITLFVGTDMPEQKF